ncbi:MAG: 16S rRNA (cytosine967-C5)-methyltransferase [Rhodospirillaceae bacterium]|nr:MAG: 16S rRNA (cytosine967-C5)-methyltransferase [Rhodospirillaceae bacterium]
MTPGGRVQAVIDLLTTIMAAPSRPADGTARAFFHERRYMGAKDRRAVADRAWAILRCRARLGWWVDHAAARRDRHNTTPAPDNVMRWYVLAYLVLVEGQSIETLAGLGRDPHGPAGLTQGERDLLAEMRGGSLDHSAMPRRVRGECPSWLEESLSARFGPALDHELAAMNREAPLDLRVNTLKTTRAQAHALLAAEGIESSPTPFAPFGLRVQGRVNVAACAPFREGLVEVQDEGSQLTALLVGARPGESVVDYCAGAGGKTLALAASMGNKGRLVACDISHGRMERATQRLRRAGVHNVIRRLLGDSTAAWFKRAQGRFDRVLADVPCTGTGTWRRNPDARWRLRPEESAELTTRQADILARAERLVRPGGRLVYTTCSLLAAENEAQVERFLMDSPTFRLIPADHAWAESTEGPWPFDPASPFLHLTPAQHGTDGYFVAVLERN